MIISSTNKFVFIKTNKTASTSVEILLSAVCGPTDVITPFKSTACEELRQSLGYTGPQNYRLKDAIDSGVPAEEPFEFSPHSGAAQVRRRIGPKLWNEYFTFCIERNPWDRLVSLYYFRRRSFDHDITFTEFLASDWPKRLKRMGWENYTIGGVVAVDKIIRYESLQQDLEDVYRHLGIKGEVCLPRAKSQYRRLGADYRQHYSDTEQRWVAENFADEIKLMGYTF